MCKIWCVSKTKLFSEDDMRTTAIDLLVFMSLCCGDVTWNQIVC